jgi:hypothetical protein
VAETAVPAPGLPDLPAGVWRHWKGHLYQVLGYAADSSIEGRIVVVYIGLELDGARPGPRLHVREAAEFLGHAEFSGALIPRFEYVAPDWQPAAPATGRGAADGDTCCDLHGRNCEPPSELCCCACTEARHAGWTTPSGQRRHGHPPGEICSNPDLSGSAVSAAARGAADGDA